MVQFELIDRIRKRLGLDQPQPVFDKAGEERLARTTAQEELRRLKHITVARYLALLAMGTIMFWSFRWPESLWSEMTLVLLALLGWARLQLESSPYARSWHGYFFVALDFVVLMTIVVIPNPLAKVTLPLPFVLREVSGLLFMVFLAALAYGLRARLVLWGGICAAATWSLANLYALSLPRAVYGGMNVLGRPETELDMRAALYRVLDPWRVDGGAWLRECILFLIVAAMLSLTVAATNRLTRTQAASERRRANLARYMPPRMIDALGENDEPFGQQADREAVVMFVDLVDFSHWTETHSSTEVLALLREVHELVTEHVFETGGVLDKFIGDGAMASYGAAPFGEDGPRSDKEQARAALRCVELILRSMIDLRKSREARGLQTPRLSIGAQWGPVMVGDVGSARRMEMAVLGDTVNVASRLESATRQYDMLACVGEALIQKAGIEPEGWENLGSQHLRGISKPVTVWALG